MINPKARGYRLSLGFSCYGEAPTHLDHACGQLHVHLEDAILCLAGHMALRARLGRSDLDRRIGFALELQERSGQKSVVSNGDDGKNAILDLMEGWLDDVDIETGFKWRRGRQPGPSLIDWNNDVDWDYVIIVVRRELAVGIAAKPARKVRPSSRRAAA